MGNPTFTAGAAITFEVGSKIEKRRVVKINSQGKIEHAAATGTFIGAVTEPGDKDGPREANNLAHGRPHHLAVHRAGAVVPLESDNASNIKSGAPVYAAADGKVASTGTVIVGTAVRNGKGKYVETMLAQPAHT